MFRERGGVLRNILTFFPIRLFIIRRIRVFTNYLLRITWVAISGVWPIPAAVSSITT